MPSDPPSIRSIRSAPAGPARPGTAPAGNTATGGGDAVRVPAGPTIVNPTLRRYWHREGDEQEPAGRRRSGLLTQGMTWAVAIALMVSAAMVLDRLAGMMETPEPGQGGGQRQDVAAGPAPGTMPGNTALPVVPPGTPLPVLAPNPDLVRSFGRGAVTRAEELARRYGLAGGLAVACGTQPATWLAAAGTALADDVTERLPAFDNDTLPAVWMQDFIRAQFRIGQMMAGQAIAARGKDNACAEASNTPDYFAIARLERNARTKAEWDARFRPEPVPEFNPVAAAGVPPGSANE